MWLGFVILPSTPALSTRYSRAWIHNISYIIHNMNDEQQALLDYTTLHPLELPFIQHSVDVGLRRGDTSWRLDHIMFYSDEKVISADKTTTIKRTGKRTLSAVARQKKGSCKLLSTTGSSLLANATASDEWEAKLTGTRTLLLEQIKLGNFEGGDDPRRGDVQFLDGATSPVTTKSVSNPKQHHFFALIKNIHRGLKSSLVLGRSDASGLCTQSCIIPAHRNAIKTLRFVSDGTPDNIWLLSGSGDKTVKIWKCTSQERGQEQADDWSCCATLTGHQHSVTAVDGVLSSDNEGTSKMVVYSGAGDATIKVWEVNLTQQTFTCVKTLTEHHKKITDLGIGHDSHNKIVNILVSSSNDGTVKVWCRLTFNCLATLQHDMPVLSMKCCSCPLSIATLTRSHVFEWSLDHGAMEILWHDSGLSPLSNPAHLSQLVLQLREMRGSTMHLLAPPVQDAIAQFSEPLAVATFEKCFEEADAARAALEQAQQIIRDHKKDDPEGPTLTQLVSQRNNSRATFVAALAAATAATTAFDGRVLRDEAAAATAAASLLREGMDALASTEELAEKMTGIDEAEGEPHDVLKLSEQATSDVQVWMLSHDPSSMAGPTEEALRNARIALLSVSRDPMDDELSTFVAWQKANKTAVDAVKTEWMHWTTAVSPLISFPAVSCWKAMEARLQMHNKIVMLSRKFREEMKKVREELARLSLLKDVPQVQIDALQEIEEQYNECYDNFDDAQSAVKKARRRKGRVKDKEAELEEIRQKLQRLQRSRENARACLVRLASTDYPELAFQDDVELGALTGEEAGILTIGRLVEQ